MNDECCCLNGHHDARKDANSQTRPHWLAGEGRIASIILSCRDILSSLEFLQFLLDVEEWFPPVGEGTVLLRRGEVTSMNLPACSTVRLLLVNQGWEEVVRDVTQLCVPAGKLFHLWYK